MSVRMRHTKGHTRNRRSHHALKEARLAKCADCGEAHLRHQVCENCGKYRGRVVINVEEQIAKKEEKAKKKRMEMEQAGMKGGEKEENKKTEGKSSKEDKKKKEPSTAKQEAPKLDASELSKK